MANSSVVNVLDLMSDAERAALRRRLSRRTERRSNPSTVTPEIYLLAELGLMFGWQAVLDVRNNRITLEEAFALLEGGRKVQSRQIVDNARGQLVATAAAYSKKPQKAFEDGMKPFTRAAEISGGN